MFSQQLFFSLFFWKGKLKENKNYKLNLQWILNVKNKIKINTKGQPKSKLPISYFPQNKSIPSSKVGKITTSICIDSFHPLASPPSPSFFHGHTRNCSLARSGQSVSKIPLPFTSDQNRHRGAVIHRFPCFFFLLLHECSSASSCSWCFFSADWESLAGFRSAANEDSCTLPFKRNFARRCLLGLDFTGNPSNHLVSTPSHKSGENRLLPQKHVVGRRTREKVATSEKTHFPPRGTCYGSGSAAAGTYLGLRPDIVVDREQGIKQLLKLSLIRSHYFAFARGKRKKK